MLVVWFFFNEILCFRTSESLSDFHFFQLEFMFRPNRCCFFHICPYFCWRNRQLVSHFFFFKMSHLFLNPWWKNCEQRFQEDTGRDDRTRIASVLLLTSSVSSETLNLVHVFPRRCTESLLWNRPARLLESVWTLPPLQRHSLFVCLTQRRYDETCVVRDSFLKDKSILIMHFPWDVVVLKATLLPRKIWEIP